jgi:Holliday junction resolvasome RuvABC endonuclease subunit
MNLLALDLGTHTGWALWENGRVESGVQAFELKRGESPGMRYLRFRRWLEEIAVRIQVIAYEQTLPWKAGSHAREISNNLAGRVQEFCAERNGVEHIAVENNTLKKWTTGRGNAGKDEMIVHVQARFTAKRGIAHDEAEAIALLHYARAELVPAERGT